MPVPIQFGVGVEYAKGKAQENTEVCLRQLESELDLLSGGCCVGGVHRAIIT